MTKFVLYSNGEHFTGFETSGHSTVNADDDMGRLVCSAVSSAVIMTANAITDIVNAKSNVEVKDGYLKVIILEPDEKTDLLIESLKLHITELSNEYNGKIEILNGGLH